MSKRTNIGCGFWIMFPGIYLIIDQQHLQNLPDSEHRPRLSNDKTLFSVCREQPGSASHSLEQMSVVSGQFFVWLSVNYFFLKTDN